MIEFKKYKERMKMKTSYINPTVSFVAIGMEDVIRTSGEVLPTDRAFKLAQGEHARVDNLE